MANSTSEELAYVKGMLGEFIKNADQRHSEVVKQIGELSLKVEEYVKNDTKGHDMIKSEVQSAQADIRKEIHSISKAQAVEKVKLGFIFSGIAVGVNEVIRRILG